MKRLTSDELNALNGLYWAYLLPALTYMTGGLISYFNLSVPREELTTGNIILGLFLGFCPGINWLVIVVGILLSSDDSDKALFFNSLIVWASAGMLLPMLAHSRRNEEVEANRRKQDEEARNAQRRQLVSVCETAWQTLKNLPRKLQAADGDLNIAQVDFAETAYEPYWAAIERAARHLADFHYGTTEVNRLAAEYTSLCAAYPGTPPSFPATTDLVEKFHVAETIATQMCEMVRLAHRDRDFAMIFQQRKTNRILVDGFGNLASTIDRVGDSIRGAVSDLSGSLERVTQRFESYHRETVAAIGSFADQERRSHFNSIEAARDAERERGEMLSMLDNIQRRRLPSI